MNIEKIKNGNNSLSILQLISTKNNSIKQSRSEIKHKDLRNIKYMNYKLFHLFLFFNLKLKLIIIQQYFYRI